MTIPAFFLANIDYQRIRDRLEQKLRIIMCIHQKKEYVKPKKIRVKANKKDKVGERTCTIKHQRKLYLLDVDHVVKLFSVLIVVNQ
jgi:hypothetical protein